MQRKLYKLGNSRGIVVPQVLLDLMKWDDETVLDVSVESDKLIFWAVAKRKGAYSMAQKKTPKDNLDIAGSKLPGMDEWQAHEDLRTIGNAETIKRDKGRMGAIKKLHAQHAKALGIKKKRGI